MSELSDAKAIKSTEIVSWFDNLIAAGYPTGKGYSLDASRDSQVSLGLDVLLCINKMNLNRIYDFDLIDFIDINYTPRSLTVREYIDLIVSFGDWCRSAMMTKYQLLGSVQLATTVEQVQAITVP